MANRYKGEVPFPQAGKGAFIRFSLDDLAELEDLFGRNFFGVIEEACGWGSPRDLSKVLAVGLKSREGEATVRIWDGIEKDPLPFTIAEAGTPVLEAIAQSLLGKSYGDLVKEAEEARKQQAEAAIKDAKEAAEKAGVPFDLSEALLSALLKPQTEPASAPSTSGD